MSIRSARLVAVAALAAVLAGCAASAQSAPLPAPRTVVVAAPANPQLDRIVRLGQQQYAREVGGATVNSLLHQVARDPAFLKALGTSDAAARAYVARQFPNVWYHWHISRLRVVRGSTDVVETGVPFVVAGPGVSLRGPGGRSLGRLEVSLQDEIGFVRLMHRNYPVDVVVRGTTSASVRSSLPAATNAALPANGRVQLAGRTYDVRSFKETAWNGEPVTIWFLAAV
jgi:hypothetical protein